MYRSTFVSTVGVMLFAGTLLQAVPTPVGPPVAGPGNGLNSRWVVTTVANKPDTIAEALAVIALAPGDPAFVSATEAIVPQIAFYDAVSPNPNSGPPMPNPVGDPRFAVLYTGYLNVTAPGPYTFSAYTDDGFRLQIGGETITQFDGNRGPSTSTGSASLGVGLYEFSFLGWEQGGQFVNDLRWALGEDNPQLIPQANFFSRRPSTGVPDGGSTLLLLGLSLAFGGAAIRRRTR